MNISKMNLNTDLFETPVETGKTAFHTPFLFLIFILALSAAGCSSKPVLVQPVANDNQSASYERGQLQLKAEADNPLELTIVEYSEDEMIIEVSVTNAGDDPFDFSDQSIKGKIISPDNQFPVNILRYDTFLKNRNKPNDEIWKRTGTTAISVGSALIPYGGIASSVAQLLFSLGQNTSVPLQDRIDASSYLRRHTVEPDTEYGGRLKIGLPKQLESGDVLMFQVSSANDIQDFRFICR